MSVAPMLVDARRGRFSQAMVTALLLIAFAGNWPLVIPAVMTVVLTGAGLGRRFDAFSALYSEVVAPRLSPPSDLEDPRPVRFAAGLHGLVLAASTIWFMTGNLNLAWAAALGVAILAGLSATIDLCVGSALYYLLATRRRPHIVEVDVERQAQDPLEPTVGISSPRFSSGWRVRGLGIWRFRAWVHIVDQTPDGDTIVRVESERFLLPRGDRRFWPVTACSTCQRRITDVDTSQGRRRVQCRSCTSELRQAPT
jgi:hypothetical protein